MKASVVLVVLFNLAVFCSATIVQQCPSLGRSIEDLNDRITIGNCKKPPCRLRKDTSVLVQMKFKTDSDVNKLTNSVSANILGIPFPFVGVDGEDACTNLYKTDRTTKVGCPLKAGEYIYKTKIDVLRVYPRLKTVVHWGLSSGEGDLICFEVPVRITN